ncbi:hypothetical protein FACS189449_05980 [Alphaproteobacteria bacterium]|nr:hypothetical protein FACS189449_05980 [Alphaproteobacteria bacterium]
MNYTINKFLLAATSVLSLYTVDVVNGAKRISNGEDRRWDTFDPMEIRPYNTWQEPYTHRGDVVEQDRRREDSNDTDFDTSDDSEDEAAGTGGAAGTGPSEPQEQTSDESPAGAGAGASSGGTTAAPPSRQPAARSKGVERARKNLEKELVKEEEKRQKEQAKQRKKQQKLEAKQRKQQEKTDQAREKEAQKQSAIGYVDREMTLAFNNMADILKKSKGPVIPQQEANAIYHLYHLGIVGGQLAGGSQGEGAVPPTHTLGNNSWFCAAFDKAMQDLPPDLVNRALLALSLVPCQPIEPEHTPATLGKASNPLSRFGGMTLDALNSLASKAKTAGVRALEAVTVGMTDPDIHRIFLLTVRRLAESRGYKYLLELITSAGERIPN